MCAILTEKQKNIQWGQILRYISWLWLLYFYLWLGYFTLRPWIWKILQKIIGIRVTFIKKKEKKIPEHYFPNLGPNHFTILKANLIQDINRGFAFSIVVLIMELFIEGSAPLWLERKFVTLLIWVRVPIFPNGAIPYRKFSIVASATWKALFIS